MKKQKFFISSHFLYLKTLSFSFTARIYRRLRFMLCMRDPRAAGSRFALRGTHTAVRPSLRELGAAPGTWCSAGGPPPRTAPRRRMTGWAGTQRPGSGRCAPGRPRTSSSRSPGSTRPHAAMSRVTELSRRLASDILDDSTLSNVLRTSFERSLAQRPRAPPAPHQIFVRWGAHTSAPSTRVRLIICTSAWARGWAQGRQASGQACGVQMNTVW